VDPVTLDIGAMSRFAAKFSKGRPDTDDCWTWTGGKSSDGYGTFWDGERVVGSHRFAFAAMVGPIPEGMCVLHKCDNPPCVRPDHLFLGTHAVNMADKVAKGRANGLKGQDNPAAKLTDAEVLAIIELRREGATQAAVAVAFEIDQTVVSSILLGKRWSHLGVADPSLAGYAKGERVKGAKLNPDSVRQIHLMSENGAGPVAIGRVMGVSESAIRRVLKGECWSHVSRGDRS